MSMDGLLQPSYARWPDSKDRQLSRALRVNSPLQDASAKDASKNCHADPG